MPQELTLRGPVYTFQVYGLEEAKSLGFVDAFRKKGTHSPVSSQFDQGEGQLLERWVSNLPDAILVATSRYGITVYRPKHKLIDVKEAE